MNHRRFPAALKLLIVVTASAATESARVDILAAVNGGFGRCLILGPSATGCSTVVASPQASKFTTVDCGELQTHKSRSVANGIPPGTFQYKARVLRVGFNAQYSFSPRLAAYGSINDLNGRGFVIGNRRYAADT